MKKKVFCLILSLLIAVTLTIPVYASNHGGMVLGNGASVVADLSAPPMDFAIEGNVIDLCGVLTPEQETALEAIAEANGDAYGCGCYAVITDNYLQFGRTASEAVINLYHGNSLGIGVDRDGILLMVDIVNREFAFFVYGENAEYIFDAYGQEELERVFIDDLSDNRWYDALEDFTLECGTYMELAAYGNPVRESKAGLYGAVIVAALVIAAVVCFILISQMKSVARGAEASAYVTGVGLVLTERKDRFMYKTTTTRDLSDDNDSSSSSSFSGGGGSGRSGSF